MTLNKGCLSSKSKLIEASDVSDPEGSQLMGQGRLA